RLDQARALASDYQPGALGGLFSRRANNRIRDLAEGLDITMRRLDQTLERYAVKPIPAAGLAIDPHRMRVISVRADPECGEGVAVEEIRRGYERGDEVLRLAEVVAS